METYIHKIIKDYPMLDDKLNTYREATVSDPLLQVTHRYKRGVALKRGNTIQHPTL